MRQAGVKNISLVVHIILIFAGWPDIHAQALRTNELVYADDSNDSVLVDSTIATIRMHDDSANHYVRDISNPLDSFFDNEQPIHLVYLNNCLNGSCTLTTGNEDSQSNSSSIARHDSVMPPFSHGDMVWDSTVACVKETFADFNITIVTDEPVDVQNYVEAIVSGHPSDIGLPNGNGQGKTQGIAPATCSGVVENAIAYAFSDAIGASAPDICSTIAHEVGHTFGLQHIYLCEDPMAYLNNCDPNKRFQNVTAQCGRNRVEACRCGGGAHNTYQTLLSQVGPNEPTPPSLEISEPKNGATVNDGFVVKVLAEDDIALDRVEFYVNRQLKFTKREPPFEWKTSEKTNNGRLLIEANAVDNFGFHTQKRVDIVKNKICEDPITDCINQGDVCIDGGCDVGPGIIGGLGESCETNFVCRSRNCKHPEDSSAGAVCVALCKLGQTGCPVDFGCKPLGGDTEFGACVLGYDDSDNGGCSATGQRYGFLGIVTLFLLAFFGYRRCGDGRISS